MDYKLPQKDYIEKVQVQDDSGNVITVPKFKQKTILDRVIMLFGIITILLLLYIMFDPLYEMSSLGAITNKDAFDDAWDAIRSEVTVSEEDILEFEATVDINGVDIGGTVINVPTGLFDEEENEIFIEYTIPSGTTISIEDFNLYLSGSKENLSISDLEIEYSGSGALDDRLDIKNNSIYGFGVLIIITGAFILAVILIVYYIKDYIELMREILATINTFKGTVDVKVKEVKQQLRGESEYTEAPRTNFGDKLKAIFGKQHESDNPEIVDAPKEESTIESIIETTIVESEEASKSTLAIDDLGDEELNKLLKG